MSETDYISRRVAVPADFEKVFTHFYVAENKSELAVTKTLLPTFQTILLFVFGKAALLKAKQSTAIKINMCMVFGPIRQSFEYTLPAGTEILVANFKDDAFFRFFGQVLATGLPLNPDKLVDDNCFTALWQVLKSIGSPEDKVSFILDFCKPYLKDRTNTYEKLAEFQTESNHLNPIKSLAQQHHVTERTIQLNYKKHLGYTAKEVARYQRFLKAIQLLPAGKTKVDWFEIINQCGYYDQSQLIHDFKHYLNLSPTQYVKFQSMVCVAIT